MARLPEYPIVIKEAGGDTYRWVIQSGEDGVIAVTNQLFGTHKQLAREEKICDPAVDRPIVFDSSYLRYDPRQGSLLITKEITNTTQPEALIGLEEGTDAYSNAAVAMRRRSVRRIADAIKQPVKAELLNGLIELFSPSDSP